MAAKLINCTKEDQRYVVSFLWAEIESCQSAMKMAAKLINCTKEEQLYVLRFLWPEIVPGAQIHLRMCAQYGDKVLSCRIVYE
jgi:hypothetical protein